MFPIQSFEGGKEDLIASTTHKIYHALADKYMQKLPFILIIQNFFAP